MTRGGGGVLWWATVFIHPKDSWYNKHLQPKFLAKIKLGYWIIQELWVCVTYWAFSLRKPWENSERDTIVHISSLMGNAVLGVFKIHIVIMREIKLHSSQKTCAALGILTADVTTNVQEKYIKESFEETTFNLFVCFGAIKPLLCKYLRWVFFQM